MVINIGLRNVHVYTCGGYMLGESMAWNIALAMLSLLHIKKDRE